MSAARTGHSNRRGPYILHIPRSPTESHGVPRRSASVDDFSETKKFQIERLTRGRRKPKGLSVQPDIQARLSLARAVCGRVGPKTMEAIPENLIWFALQFIYHTTTAYAVVSLIEMVF